MRCLAAERVKDSSLQAGGENGVAHAGLQRPRFASDRSRATFSVWDRQGPWRDGLRRRMLAVADGVAVLATVIALPVLFGASLDTTFWAAVVLPIWLVLAKLHGLYDRDHRALRHLTVDEAPSIFLWAMTATAVTALLSLPTPSATIETSVAFRMWLLAAVGAFTLRGIVRVVWRRISPPETTMIIGTGALADATRRKLKLFPDIHVRLIENGHVEVNAGDEPLPDVDRIILASQSIDEDAIARLVARCRRARVKLSVVPPVRAMFGTAVRLSHVADLPVVEYNTWDVSRSTMLLKRLVDVVGSALALVLLTPLFVAIAAAIRLDSRGPIFFVQRRAGLEGRPFQMLKFRTMVSNAEDLLGALVAFDKLDDPMFKLRNDPRVTRVGRFLRRTSLDELPQLLNVLNGHMSLVGPRPEQVELVERYRPEHRFRLAVKPGITGPMQVFGRGELSFEERLAVEREYIENLSLGRDIRILALTFPTVLLGRGAF